MQNTRLQSIFNKEKRSAVFGFVFFVGMMTAGYFYNLTFVQFGLLDLASRLIGMSEGEIAANMALLAGITAIVAILFGFWMMKDEARRQFKTKLRFAFGVILLEVLLTGIAPYIREKFFFTTWIVLTAIALGIAIPVTFGMATDLVPVRNRGLAGALIAAGAYFPAATLPPDWTIERFSTIILPVMVGGLIGLGLLAFGKFSWTERLVELLSHQHEVPEFSHGRFIRLNPEGQPYLRRSLLILLILMFGIYFVDSLGFLRLAHEPLFFETAWQSPNPDIRLVIGGTHVGAALIAGVLYSELGERELFLWIFGIFGLVHFMYVFSTRLTPTSEPSLAMPLLYAVAVSLYTVVNFAVWADASTPHTISRNTALGVALSAWTATFTSTALALWMRTSGVSLETHLRIVDAVSISFFLLVGLIIFFSPVEKVPKRSGS